MTTAFMCCVCFLVGAGVEHIRTRRGTAGMRRTLELALMKQDALESKINELEERTRWYDGAILRLEGTQ